MVNPSSSSGRSMGEAFQTRRAAVAAARSSAPAQHEPQSQHSTHQSHQKENQQGGPSRRFLDIQAEQQKQKQQQQQQQQQAQTSSGGYRDSSARRRNSPSASTPTPTSTSTSNQSRHPMFHRGSGGGGGGGGGGGQRRGNNRQSLDRSHLPLEQGRISSLKDSFGFIYCADRPDDLFFHFSQVQSCHPLDLQVDDEVEFRVGVSSNKGAVVAIPTDQSLDKLAAFDLTRLERGTIVWEFEENPGVRFRGIVQKPIRPDRYSGGGSGGAFSGGSGEGSIRVLLPDDDGGGGGGGNHEDDDDDEKVDRDGTLATLDKGGRTPSKKPSENSGTGTHADATGDLILFTVANCNLPDATDGGDSAGAHPTSSLQRFRRSDSASNVRSGTGRLCLNDLVEFSIVTSKRNKLKYAQNISILESDRDRQRKEREQKLLEKATMEQGIVTALKQDYGFIKSNRRREEVYFHYSNVDLPSEGDDDDDCDHSDHGDNNNDEQSPGQDEYVLKEGQEVEFLVVDETGGRKGSKVKLSARQVKLLPSGTVEFQKVLAEGVTGKITRCPHPSRDMGDQFCGVVRLSAPLSFQCGDDDGAQPIEEVVFDASVAPGGPRPTGRDGAALGFWVREGDTLLFDVVRDTADGIARMAPTRCKHPVSTEETQELVEQVEDASLPPSVRLVEMSLAGRAEGVIQSVKEGFGFISFAERSVDVYFRVEEILPPSLQTDLRNAMGQTTEGDLELSGGVCVQFDMSIQGGSPPSKSRNRRGNNDDKEKLKAQRILLLSRSSVIRTKVIAEGATGVVGKVDAKNPFGGIINLNESLQPMTASERYPFAAKLIRSFKESDRQSLVFPDLLGLKETEVFAGMVEFLGNGELTTSHIPVPSEPKHPGRILLAKKKDADTSVGGACVAKEEREGHGSDESLQEVTNLQGSEPKKQSSNEAKKMDVTPVSSVRYDKSCLSEETKLAIPPRVGEKVEFNVVQSRRTGVVSVTNLNILERLVEATPIGKRAGIGVVSEVVPSRQFGFIHILNENATKRDQLFFHFKDVAKNPPAPDSEIRKNAGPTVRKGDEVKFQISTGGNGKRVATEIEICPKGSFDISNKPSKDACLGILLMEPSHTSLSEMPERRSKSRSKSPKGRTAARWENVDADDSKAGSSKAGASIKEQGCILLIKDDAGLFSEEQKHLEKTKEQGTKAPKEAISPTPDAVESTECNANRVEDESNDLSPLCSHVYYKTGAVVVPAFGMDSGPKRGDLVSFVKSKNGRLARDVRVMKKGTATLQRGRLENICVKQTEGSKTAGTAKFVASTDAEEEYGVDLKEVVSCDVSILKEKELVEGILHNGMIYGICRTADLYLESKLSASRKERPKLNLTVRKDLGGKIMAQSMMAKGPDGTTGFVSGWTSRVSKFSQVAAVNAENIGEEQRSGHETQGSTLNNTQPEMESL